MRMSAWDCPLGSRYDTIRRTVSVSWQVGQSTDMRHDLDQSTRCPSSIEHSRFWVITLQLGTTLGAPSRPQSRIAHWALDFNSQTRNVSSMLTMGTHIIFTVKLRITQTTLSRLVWRTLRPWSTFFRVQMPLLDFSDMPPSSTGICTWSCT
jgi:hypothetical protein